MIDIYIATLILIFIMIGAIVAYLLCLHQWSKTVDDELDMIHYYCEKIANNSNAIDRREVEHYAELKRRINATELKLIGWRNMCTDITLAQSRQQAEIEAIKMVINEEEGDN